MISQQTIPVGGLHLRIYGLGEYVQQSSRMPIAAMFALHCGDEHEQEMHSMCESLCSLNNMPDKKRHMIAIAFDLTDSLRRSINDSEMELGDDRGPSAVTRGEALDSWRSIRTTLKTLSALMNILDYYLFGPYQPPRIQSWGITGYSFGGTIALWAGAVEPRFSVVIPIAAIPDYLPISRRFLRLFPEEEDIFLERPHAAPYFRQEKSIEAQLARTKVLLLASSAEGAMPAREIQKFASRLRKVHRGREGYDWGMTVALVDNEPVTSCMMNAATTFCGRWMAETMELGRPRAML